MGRSSLGEDEEAQTEPREHRRTTTHSVKILTRWHCSRSPLVSPACGLCFSFMSAHMTVWKTRSGSALCNHRSTASTIAHESPGMVGRHHNTAPIITPFSIAQRATQCHRQKTTRRKQSASQLQRLRKLTHSLLLGELLVDGPAVGLVVGLHRREAHLQAAPQARANVPTETGHAKEAQNQEPRRSSTAREYG